MNSSLNIHWQFFSELNIFGLKMQNVSLPCPTGRCYPEQVERKLTLFFFFFCPTGQCYIQSIKWRKYWYFFCPTGRCYPEQVERKLTLEQMQPLWFFSVVNFKVYQTLPRCYSKELLFSPRTSMIIIVDPLFWRTFQSPNLKLKYLDGIFKALIFLPTVQAVFILLYFVVIVFGLTGKVSSSKINTDMIFVKNFTQPQLLGK